MRPYTKALLSMGALLLLIIVAVWGITIRNLTVIADKPGPLYQGRTLSEWLFIYSENVHLSKSTATAQAEEARKAIQTIGTNASPVVLEWLAEDPTNARLLLLDYFPSYLMSKAQRSLASKKSEEYYRRSGRAIFFFRVLGANAANAIPALTQIIYDRPEINKRSIYALAMIGTNSLPEMTTLLATTNATVRATAARSIMVAQHDGVDWSAAIPLLLHYSEDAESRVSLYSIATLGIIGQQPEACIPVLTNRITSTNKSVRQTTVVALGRFGAGATAAIPALLTRLKDSEELIRGSTTNALHKIAPDIYTNVWR